MAIMLSIDFDFFVRVEGETPERKVTIFPGTDKEETVAALWLFDWSRNEGQPAAVQRMLWYTRHGALARHGIDPEALVAIDHTRGCVTPEKFSDIIYRRFVRSEDAPLWISDSHTFGFHAARQAWLDNHRRPVRVVHFDAHADLGYSADQAAEWTERHAIQCGNWLFAAIDAEFVSHVEVVYPDWRGTNEWDSVKCNGHLRELFKKRKLKSYTWTEYLETKPRSDHVAITHLCRSSAWTPPWLDRRFETFTRTIYSSETVCLDCAAKGGAPGAIFTLRQQGAVIQPIGPHDACTPRPWDRADAEAWTVKETDALASVQARRTILD